MSTISLKKILYHHFSFLKKEDELEHENSIKNDPDYAALDAMFDKKLSGRDISVPNMDQLGDAIWQRAMVENATSKFRLKRRSFVRRFAVPLAAACMVAITFGVMLFIPGASAPQVVAKAIQGTELRDAKGILARVGATVRLQAGAQIAVSKNYKLRIVLPGNGSLLVSGPAKLRLQSSKLAKGKPVLVWRVKQGRLLASLKKRSYTKFAVRTPHMVCRVVGTQFSLDVAPTKTVLRVKSGKVATHLVDKPDKVVTLGKDEQADFTQEKIILPAKKPKAKEAKDKPLKKKVSFDRIFLRDGTKVTCKVLAIKAGKVFVLINGARRSIDEKLVDKIKYNYKK